MNQFEHARSIRRWLTVAVFGAGALVTASGCTAAAGAGVAAVAIGAAIATSECYGYVDVLVMDGATGGRACDASVSAARDDDVVPFTSCFYAPLTEGRWRLDVTKPGYQSVTSEINVEPKENCERVVHYVSVRLDSLTAPARGEFGAPATANQAPPAAAPATEAPVVPTTPPPESSPPSPPAPAPAPSSSAVPGAPAPSAAPAPPAAPAPSSPPASAPPTQSFPTE